MTNCNIKKNLIINDIDNILNMLNSDNQTYALNMYLIEDTKSKAKNKSKWYNVFDAGNDENCKKDFKNKILDTLKNLKSGLGNGILIKNFLELDENDIDGDSVDVMNTESIELFESPFEIDTFSEIFKQIKQRGKGNLNIKKSIGGYAYDIDFENSIRIIAYITNKKTTLIKKDSIAINFIDGLIKISNDMIIVPLDIDFFYIEFNSRKYCLIINKRGFEKLLKYDVYCIEIAKKSIELLANSNIVVIKDDELKKQISTDMRINKKLTHMYKYGKIKFFNNNDENSIKERQKVITLLEKSKEKNPDMIAYTIEKNNGEIAINIDSKNSMMWFINAYNKDVLVDVIDDDVFLSNSKSTIKPKSNN